MNKNVALLLHSGEVWLISLSILISVKDNSSKNKMEPDFYYLHMLGYGNILLITWRQE